MKPEKSDSPRQENTDNHIDLEKEASEKLPQQDEEQAESQIESVEQPTEETTANKITENTTKDTPENTSKKSDKQQVITQEKPKPTANQKTSKRLTDNTSLSKRQLLTAVLVFIFALFIIFLHLNSRESWIQENLKVEEKAQTIMDSANAKVTQYEALQAVDSLRVRAFKMNYFDAYDENHFRIYGLFRDKSREYNISTVAKKFNVTSPNAVKMSQVGDEKWFVIPIKAVHYIQKGETVQSIAQKYYFNKTDASLIQDFNLNNIQEGKLVFIPFN